MRRGGNLPRVRPGQVNALVEGGRRAHQRLQRHGARPDRPSSATRRARATASPPTAVMAWVPFSSARPSLAAKLQRLQTGAAQGLAAGNPLAAIERLALRQ